MKQNRLEHHRLNILVYVRYNTILREEASKGNYSILVMKLVMLMNELLEKKIPCF